MDASKLKKLVDELSAARLYLPIYHEANRRWFVDRLIRSFEAAGEPESAAEQKTRDTITAATAIAKADRDLALALEADGNRRYSRRALRRRRRERVEAIYGAIAHHPAYADPENREYLRFTVKRRFRSVCRMSMWVNPNRAGYMRYPNKCKADSTWRVNEDAAPFWQRASPAWPIKIKLKPQAGSLEPVTALRRIFTRKVDACKGNLLDCSTVATITFMDALLEAKNPEQFLDRLAGFGGEYLLIHQIGRSRTSNFENDTRATRVMEDAGVAAEDLQIGDHLYIYNHPLYRTFRPTGSWRGEHAFVYRSGNRDYKSRKGFVFGGHGMGGTLFRFYDKFLSELKSHLALARRIMWVHLARKGGGDAAIAPGSATVQDMVLGDGGGTFEVWEYAKQIAVRNFERAPSRNNPRPKQRFSAFVVVHSKSDHAFWLGQIEEPDGDAPLGRNLIKRRSDVAADGELHHGIKFVRTSAPPSGASPNVIYDPLEWAVSYEDRATGTEKTWRFFEMKGGKMKRIEITHDDLFESPFTLFRKSGTELRVRRPRNDLTNAYRSYLSDDGAI